MGKVPVAVVSDGTDLWVANSAGNTVTKLRAGDGVTVETLAIGKGPRAVAFDGIRIRVGNTESNTVTRIEVG